MLLAADVTEDAVQKTLIERFDLIRILVKYPEIVNTMNPTLFETFISGGVVSYDMALPLSQTKSEVEVVQAYGYPAGWRLKEIEQQFMILRDFFPGLELKAEIPASLPEGAEGWLLVPKPSRIANNYNEALQKLLSLDTGVQPTFLNLREGKLSIEHLQMVEDTNQILDRLEQSTPGDYLILAVQCGQQHRAKSVLQVRRTFKENEYGLGPFEIASLLITHPDRLSDYEHLAIDCPGCEYTTSSDGDFSYSLYFTWGEEGLYLDCSSIEGVAPGFGSASGFLI